MESFNPDERGKSGKFYVSHRLQELEDEFKKDGGCFKEYKIGELFTSQNGNFDIQQKHINGRGQVVVSSGIQNSGIIGKTDVEARIFPKNTITVDMFGNAFYRDFSYKMVTHARIFSLKSVFTNVNEKVILYMSVCLQFLNKIFSYSNMAGWEKVKNESIYLPTKNNKPDFTFMEEYIHVLETERVHVLENYLHVSGLDSYSLTSEEATVLNNLRSGNVVFKQYKIGNLFDIEGIRQAKSQSAIPNDDKGIPYVVQSQFNNMVSRFVNEEYLCNNNEPVCEGNAIVLGVTLAAVSYQDRKFGASQVITARAKFLNENIGNYFVALLRKLMVQFSYQNKPGIKIYKEMMVSLPTNENNQPDFAFMETYIQAIKKKVIKNVVDWKDKEIEKTKDVVSNMS